MGGPHFLISNFIPVRAFRGRARRAPVIMCFALTREDRQEMQDLVLLYILINSSPCSSVVNRMTALSPMKNCIAVLFCLLKSILCPQLREMPAPAGVVADPQELLWAYEKSCKS